MIPLKVAFLWHNHQPNYELDGEYILPWVRFHCIKDYLVLPSILLKYPNLKQTFNFVPSLIDQIEMLANGNIIDSVLKYTYPNPNELANEEKQFIIDNFFTCNFDNMISKYDRYNELYSKKNEIVNNWSEQELLDLQVWYNLTWCGDDIKNNYFINRLFNRGKNFTQDEKLYLIEIQLNYLKQFISNLNLLKKSNQIEISFSPYYHPILPLLYDFKCVSDNLPELKPEVEFEYKEDADRQIIDSINKYEEIFNERKLGMWSSEGSLSNEILDMFISHNIDWTASDKDILKNTFGELYNHLEIYFPRTYKNKNGEINIYFRDSGLSDKIGFNYANMEPNEAVIDFRRSLEDIRQNLIMTYGDDILYKSCVYIILDGENCWEFYKNNGLDFINKLFEMLSVSDKLKTVTMSESSRVSKIPFDEITNIKAGSWIYGNFKIWAGESKNHLAWKVLSDARNLLETYKNKIKKEVWEDAYYYMLRAEASDWFWWYYSQHQAPNKLDFDTLFRNNLIHLYKILNEKVPTILKSPLWTEEEINDFNFKKGNDTMHKVE